MTPSMHPIKRLPLLTLLLLAAPLLLLPACGGGGGAPIVLGAPPPLALAITTTSLPGAGLGQTVSWPLTAENVRGSPVWDLSSGALPGGLELAPNGVISGTLSAEGPFDFVVRVTDEASSDTQALQVLVGFLEASVSDGLTVGDAWTQKPVTLTTNGAVGTVSFSVVSTVSGGAFSAVDPNAGTATWTPGATGGQNVVDTLRATDDESGAPIDIAIPVMQDPTANHVAAFGSTDVWWVDPDQKFGAHAYTTDLHEALADAGLRDPGSTGATGTEADELALLWFRVELLRQTNVMFLREADGSAGAQGLAISFPFEEPGAGYNKPSPASTLQGLPTRYSQMAFTHGTNDGVIGTAFIDSANNRSHENDTSDEGMELGVFTNQILPFFDSSYRNTLDDDPVGADDVDVLRALLYGLPSPGGRFNQIRDMGRGLARTMAAVLAHEVGHSLGLGHTSPSAPGSIMNASATISPSANYVFTADDVTTLQSALPGAGKTSAALTAQKAGSEMPAGGVAVCHCRVCTSGEK